MNLSRPVKLPLVWGLTSTLIGMLLTCFIAIRVERQNNLVAQNNLIKEAERLAHETLKRIGLYEYGLRGARGFILGTANQLSRENFNQYSLTRDYEREFPGARGFGFIKRVPFSQEKNFLEQARADGEPDFAIHQFMPHQNERYIIQYIEPQKPNQLAIGLDISSEKFRRTAAETAILTGQVQITAPITLVQANQKLHQSFLMLLAVYSSWTIPAENERWQQTVGWVFTPLSMQDILDTLNVDDNFYQLKLSDVSNLQEPVDFYNSETDNRDSSLYSHRVTRLVYGRTWQFDITAKPQLLSALSPIKISDVYTLGVLISLLFGFLAAILGSNRQAKQKIAMTALLEKRLMDS
jgi:CHASE1-domain containing sensor protein